MYRVVVRISYYTTISNGDMVEVSRSYAEDGVENLADVAGFTHALIKEALGDYASDLYHNGIDYLITNIYNIDEEDF